MNSEQTDQDKYNNPQVVDFYGYDFLVTPDVLTPRPETEQLIDTVLDLCGQSYLPGVKASKPVLDPNNLVILDVGTGSGCIAIVLKQKLPHAKVYASDISKKALKIAQRNAKLQGTHITLIISYLLTNVNITPNLIVANLPYVDKNWDWLDQNSLKDDPDLALYAKDHGLALIKELISAAKSKYLVLEADPTQHKTIIEYAKNRYSLIRINGFILTFISNSQKLPSKS